MCSDIIKQALPDSMKHYGEHITIWSGKKNMASFTAMLMFPHLKHTSPIVNHFIIIVTDTYLQLDTGYPS